MPKKIKPTANNRTTYRIGLLQAKAYRTLKNETALHLEPLGISSIEWAFLGLLYEVGSANPSAAAEEVGVEAPFVTSMTRKLKKLGFVAEEKDALDSRKKQLCLTAEGRKFVTTTEAYMRARMRPLLEGIPARAFADYLLVLAVLIKNIEKK